jgi:hypothetical protein
MLYRQQKPADSISGRKCEQQREDCEKLDSERVCKESFIGRKGRKGLTASRNL